ncbi:putative disease resistance protein At4g11170 [Neltuma alba]|uniref:putative disease resistance protein At4g11170 n=1 Tax=Neltuma alba TaxID=207710 RepID=UPI0010A2B6BD|nr:putative disease resistance protein At4g11170 [Prosopis alba]
MASPVPCSQYPKPHDIFISFRGEDTRGCFTCHLCDALSRSGIKETFVDRKLPKGKDLWRSLEKAIEDSTMYVVIFSENFASSTWCLEELTKILERSRNQRRLVVPVFYRVDPSHVRKQSESYHTAFVKLEGKGISKQLLQKWKKSLTVAANLAGFRISEGDDEADRIKTIVKRVTKILRNQCPNEDNLEDFIGIKKRMKDVELLLDKGSNDVRIICIWGMGGLGKTTLARALYNKWCSEYKGSHHFVEKVGETSKNHGVEAVKKDLISALLGDKISHTSHYDMTRLKRKEVFIVLDDVDGYDQVNGLVGRRNWFKPGSKILITTRDKQVLGAKVDRDAIYQLKGLDSKEAFQLFSLHAFGKGCSASSTKLRRLAQEVTRYANGNSLALKVLGSSLFDEKDQKVWESRLKKLPKLFDLQINKVLKISLEGLLSKERECFLDIACLLTGDSDVDGDNDVEGCLFTDGFVTVREMLEARRGYPIAHDLKRLRETALLEVDDESGRISMHDLLREMGRQLVRDESPEHPARRSRLWDPKEISEILGGKESNKAIEGVSLNLPEVGEMRLSPKAFRSMPNLKILNFYFYHKIDDGVGIKLQMPDGIDFLPEKLIKLCWMGYPLKSLPVKFKAENLVQFEMPHSSLRRLWDGVQNLPNLIKITLAQSEDLIELPDFSKATRLKHVNLDLCSKLRSVHPSILSRHSLRRLWLRHCKSLASLTSDTHLRSLIRLDAGGCSGLKEFSVTSENNEFYLDLSGTAISGALRSSSGHRSKIRSLSLNNCRNVTSVHKLIKLGDLRRLEARGCKELASCLLSKCEEMRALEVLWLQGCNELSELPNDIRLLSSLLELNLSGTHVRTLPSNIKRLSSLRSLKLDGCKRLRLLPELPPSLLTLNAANCVSLETIQYSPLINKGEEGKDKACPCFIFTNCKKLNRRAIKAAEARVLLEINKGIYDFARLEYPGERLPKWFVSRSTKEDPMTVNLCSIPRSWDGRFYFGAVVSELPQWTDIEVRWFVDGQYACRVEDSSSLAIEQTSSDHVFVWYRPDSLRQLKRKIESKERDAQSKTYRPCVEIKFRLRKPRGKVITEAKIKECGPPYVCRGIHALVALYFDQCTSSLFSSDHRLPPRHQSAVDFAINCKSTMVAPFTKKLPQNYSRALKSRHLGRLIFDSSICISTIITLLVLKLEYSLAIFYVKTFFAEPKEGFFPDATHVTAGGFAETDLLGQVKSESSRKIICSTIANSGVLFAYSIYVKPNYLD